MHFTIKKAIHCKLHHSMMEFDQTLSCIESLAEENINPGCYYGAPIHSFCSHANFFFFVPLSVRSMNVGVIPSSHSGIVAWGEKGSVGSKVQRYSGASTNE